MGFIDLTECCEEPELDCVIVDSIGWDGFANSLDSGSNPRIGLVSEMSWVASHSGTISDATMTFSGLPRGGAEEYSLLVGGSSVATFNVPQGLTGGKVSLTNLSISVAQGQEVSFDILSENQFTAFNPSLEFKFYVES